MELADRVREQLAGEEAVSEQAMFGGLAFLLRGHMAVAVSRQGGLLVRVPPGEADHLLSKPHARVAEMGGRRMTGWVRVAPEGVKTARQLSSWVKVGSGYTGNLAPKMARRGRPKMRATTA